MEAWRQAAMSDLADIVTDLNRMAHEQGGMLNTIESNVMDSRANVKEGVAELTDANEYDKSAKRKMIILASAPPPQTNFSFSTQALLAPPPSTGTSILVVAGLIGFLILYFTVLK